LDMFSSMTTYSMTLLKEQCWTRLHSGKKKDEDQDGDMIASEKACQKPAGNIH